MKGKQKRIRVKRFRIWLRKAVKSKKLSYRALKLGMAYSKNSLLNTYFSYDYTRKLDLTRKVKGGIEYEIFYYEPPK